ncbi:MAG: DegT/DnrJ/EryC1/StrS family aminotransferase [Acidimicrobiia bacterium]
MRLPTDQDASGRTLGAAELARLEAVIASGTLTATRGQQTPELERRFAELIGRRHAVACS